MFGIGATEFLLIAVLALILFGPDKLPQFARTIGRLIRDFKRYQDIMESTIRAEIYAPDAAAKKAAAATDEEAEAEEGAAVEEEGEGESTDETDEPAPEPPIEAAFGAIKTEQELAAEEAEADRVAAEEARAYLEAERAAADAAAGEGEEAPDSVDRAPGA